MKRRKRSASPEGRRLREILAILARHNLVQGFSPEKLRQTIEDLGPTFVKLGQIMSMRRDMLPPEYCAELSKLRAEVKPLELSQVRAVIEAEYHAPLEQTFAAFEPQPLGAASIAQVHAATLLPRPGMAEGRRVVVKVQRPGIRETMEQDITLLHKAADILKLTEMGEVIDLNMVLDEMWSVAKQEMDFLTEARNAEEFREKNRDVRYVTCPRIEHDLTTSRVLVMEYIDGIPIDDTARLTEAGYELAEIGAKLADNYVKQVIDDGFFHADPHPGNLCVRDGKLVWIDLGMMGRLSARDQGLFRDAVRAVVNGDVEALKNIVLTMGVYTARIDQVRLYGDIDAFLTKYGRMELGAMDLGRILEELMSLARDHQISLPKGVSMLGRGVMTLEGVVSAVSPETNIVQIMANRFSAELLHDVDWGHELRSGARKLYESGRKSVEVPGQLSDLLRMAVRGQSKLNLEIIGSEQPLRSIDYMVNKLIKCILAAALLLGSCLICTTDMKPKFLDIPFFGLLGFAASLVMGIWLLIDMHRGRRKERTGRRGRP